MTSPAPRVEDTFAIDDAPSVSTDSLENSGLSAPVVQRLRRRSDRPSSVISGRPTFDIADRAPFDISNPKSTSAPFAAHDAEEVSIQVNNSVTAIPAPLLPVVVETFEVDDRPVIDKHARELQRRKAAIYFAACCLSMILSGWNDGSLGPLIPTIQDYYHV
jgi:hypothetical protein